MSVLETMFGLGLMIGPLAGGLLYDLNGFYLPFVVCGSALIACSFMAFFWLTPPDQLGASSSTTEEPRTRNTVNATFCGLLKIPAVLHSCFTVTLTEISVAWYLPSLQVERGTALTDPSPP